MFVCVRERVCVVCMFVCERVCVCVYVCSRRRNVRGGWLTWKIICVNYVSNRYCSFEINL